MAKDPICGMTVDEATVLRAERDGETFYFCSEHCRKTFLSQNAPAKTDGDCCGGTTRDDAPDHAHQDYSHQGHEHAAVTRSVAAKYFCPMCPGVQSDKPGDCPKCGMALERNPAWVAPTAGKAIYTCPMHPEVQQDHPGDCRRPTCSPGLMSAWANGANTP